jgi:SAM-dependent methyltransferase
MNYSTHDKFGFAVQISLQRQLHALLPNQKKKLLDEIYEKCLQMSDFKLLKMITTQLKFYLYASVSDRPRKSVLDLGCGQGRDLARFASACEFIVGGDNDLQQLFYFEQICKKLKLNFQTLQLDLQHPEKFKKIAELPGFKKFDFVNI